MKKNLFDDENDDKIKHTPEKKCKKCNHIMTWQEKATNNELCCDCWCDQYNGKTALVNNA